MSIAPSAMPFHTDDEPMRNHGSTASSFDPAPSPTGPTIWSSGISTPVDLERAGLVAAQAERVPLDGWAWTSSPSITNTDRSS